MSTSHLNHLILLPKELAAVHNIIDISCESFKLANYPIYYDCFLTHIYNMIQMGAIAATSTFPLSRSNFHKFGVELDTLASFMQRIRAIEYYQRPIGFCP
jgi:hypothetical protein